MCLYEDATGNGWYEALLAQPEDLRAASREPSTASERAKSHEGLHANGERR